MTSETHNYAVEVSGSPTTGVPSLSARFGRITVILGSNGTGKSRILKQIRQLGDSFGNRSPVYIEGGRVITIPPAISYDHNTFNEFGTLQRAQNTFRARRLANLAARTRDAFFLLERRGQQLKITHSDAVSEWQAQGCPGPCPRIGDDPMESLFHMFSEVFPEISISLETENKQITCRKNGGSPYSTSELSDGERQALFILADIALSAETLSLIVADEPELNLNPLLANRLWDTIEGRLPQAAFVYGTHSISFAMRKSIDTIIALQGGGRTALQLQSVHDLDRTEAKRVSWGYSSHTLCKLGRCRGRRGRIL